MGNLSKEVIRHELIGNARNLPSLFDTHFMAFDNADKAFMVLVKWVSAVSGYRPMDQHFTDSKEEAQALFDKYSRNKEVQDCYLFDRDLGINLVKDSSNDRNKEFLSLFEESLSKA